VLDALRDAAGQQAVRSFLEERGVPDAVLAMSAPCRRNPTLWRQVAADPEQAHVDELRRRATDDYLSRWHLLSTIARLDGYVESAKEDRTTSARACSERSEQLYGEYERFERRRLVPHR